MSRALAHIVSVLLSVLISVIACAQDIPPGVPNMQSFASGSYVIPMDNDKQALNGEPFNLSSYGLIYNLLEQGVPLHWVIKSGKNKDEVDFSALASRMYPTPSGSAMLDFRASAFIIDLSNVQAEVSCGGITNSLVDQAIVNFGEDVAVYRLDQNVTVDVRYTLTSAPVIAVLADGCFEDTEENVLEYAHVPFDVISYSDFETNSACYTFIAQPHMDDQSTSSCQINNLDITAYTNIISNFLTAGGNFFAQCASIPTFENEGTFLTTNGVDNFGVTNNPPDQPLGSNLNYDNNDMPVMQFDGPAIGYEVGSTFHFDLNGGSFLSHAYSGVWKNYNGNPSYLVAAGDLNGAALGGNVFYLAGHDYTPNTTIVPSGNNGSAFQSDVIESYNLNRVALNAAFVPASWVATCVSADRCICPGDAVNIGCSDSAPITYSWSPTNDLSCTNCPNPIASPSVTTTYTASGPGGCSSNSVTVIVDCPFIIASQDTICVGDCATITIDEQINNTPVTLEIDGVPQLYTSIVTNLCPTTTTTYTFTVIDNLGITFSDEVVVDVFSEFTPMITATNEICAGETITFSAQGVINALWNTAEAISCTSCASPSMELIDDFTIEVSGTDANGCAIIDDYSQVVNPVIPIVIEDQVFMCITDTCITLNAVNVSSVEWLLLDGTIVSNELSVEVCPQAPTIYIAQTNNTGCFEPEEVLVDVVVAPNVAARPDTIICPGQSVNLYATGAASYTWMDDQGNNLDGAAPIVAPLFTQSYEVVGTSSEGCSSSDIVVVNTHPLPIAQFETVAPDGFFSQLPIYFNNTSVDADCFLWDIHDNPHFGSTAENYMHIFNEPGAYQVDLLVCNELNCFDSVSQTVYLGSEFYFYVPSAFTPNESDDMNSFFKVYGVNISEHEFKLDIFNRWGEIIYVLNHPDDVWLGNHVSNESYFVPDGVYNWRLQLRDKYTLMQYEAQGHVWIFR